MAAATYAPTLVLITGRHLRELAGEHAVRVWESCTRRCHPVSDLSRGGLAVLATRLASAGSTRTPSHPTTRPPTTVEGNSGDHPDVGAAG